MGLGACEDAGGWLAGVWLTRGKVSLLGCRANYAIRGFLGLDRHGGFLRSGKQIVPCME